MENALLESRKSTLESPASSAFGEMVNSKDAAHYRPGELESLYVIKGVCLSLCPV
jgi:hypothetical protein